MKEFARLREMVHDISGVPQELITPESTADQLKLDLLDMAELMLSVEEEFDVLIEDDAAIQTMGDLVQLLQIA
ncbi:MAG: phosphopantetheine-binding protein [Candidatus Pelethousia sp.]|nr:phosphopantetheine-binding protein [Candidatus Pelethousia sp.]